MTPSRRRPSHPGHPPTPPPTPPPATPRPVWVWRGTARPPPGHSCAAFLPVAPAHAPGRPRPLAPPPLRSAEASQLLRARPPACPATVLTSFRIPALGVLPLATSPSHG